MTAIASDMPIVDPAQDKFSRWPFAQRIAQTIATRKDLSSIIIGIYGTWGDGKTTVLNFIEIELSQYPDIVSFRFNPWRFSDETKMLLGFFHNLAEATGKSETNAKEKIGEWIGKYLTTVASAFGQAETVENLSKLLSSVEIEEIKSRINEMLLKEGKKVLILIDDIDRLDKNEIQSLFRLVKLNADFVNTAYILAFDDDMVAAALQEKYSAAGSESGRNFLEKIIQVPLDLPAIPTSLLRDFCFPRIDQVLNEAGIQLSQEDIGFFTRGYIDGLEIRVKTPRMATRYANILAFSLPILKNEVYPVDLMLVEGIRLFYPKLYETIKRNPDLFLGKDLSSPMGNSAEQQKKKTRELIETSLSDFNSEEKRDAISLLQTLFPRLKGVYGNTYFVSDWDITWTKSKRIASQDYFPRYFSYSIPITDISDISLDSFIDSLGEKPNKDSVDLFVNLSKANNVDRVISKLRQRSDQIPPDSSMVLAFIIAGSGNLFPRPNQLFTFHGTFSQAAMLVGSLILNIPEKEARLEYAKQLISVAEPLPFAIEINRWFRNEKDEANQNGFSSDEKKLLRALLAKRIKKVSSKTNILSEFPSDSGSIFLEWSAWGKEGDASSYLKKILKKNPSLINILLDSIVPNAWEIESGKSFKGDLERSFYDYISKIITPSKVIDVLTQLYGDKLIIEEYPHQVPGEDVNLRLAQQFAWIHKKVQLEIQNKEDNSTGDSENGAEEKITSII